ncbi:MAG: hypothetical protein QM831_32905 [Kofleriaceae bacterium]
MWRCVVACCVVAACADVPTPLTYSGPQLSVTTDSAGTHVISDGVFELDFSPTGAMLPNHMLDAQGTELLGTSTVCGEESGIGVSAKPGVVVAGGNSVTASNLEIQAGGPSAALIHITYSTSYTCPATIQFTGSTDLMITPSGRIVRYDDIKGADQTVSTTSGKCGCASSASEFSLSTFYTFAPGGTQVEPNGTTPAAAGDMATCSMYPNRGVAVSFGSGSTRYANGAHVFDWIQNQASLDDGEYKITDAMQIGAAGQSCQQLVDLLQDPHALIDGTDTVTDNVGVFTDSRKHTKAFTVTPVAGGKLVPGWVLSVDLGGADHATITRDPDMPGHTIGVPQRLDGDRYLIFFPDGLDSGETITITPQ